MKIIEDIAKMVVKKVNMENYCFLICITRSSYTSSLYKIENNESKYAENIIEINKKLIEDSSLRGITVIIVKDKKITDIKNIKKYNKELHTHELYDLILFQEYGIEPEHEQHKEELQESIKAEKIKKSLVYACYENNMEKITNCLKKTSKTALDKKMKYTGTPLGLCVKNNNLEAFKALLKAGASLDKKSLNETPLEMAYIFSPDIVSCIHNEYNEYFKEEVSKKGFSIAAKCKDVNSLELLLKYNFDINGKEEFPNLHNFVDSNNIIGVKFLLENGADISKKNIYNQTAIDRAIRSENKEIIEFLEKYSLKLKKE